MNQHFISIPSKICTYIGIFGIPSGNPDGMSNDEVRELQVHRMKQSSLDNQPVFFHFRQKTTFSVVVTDSPNHVSNQAADVTPQDWRLGVVFREREEIGNAGLRKVTEKGTSGPKKNSSVQTCSTGAALLASASSSSSSS
jgi:hypothetical protein